LSKIDLFKIAQKLVAYWSLVDNNYVVWFWRIRRRESSKKPRNV